MNNEQRANKVKKLLGLEESNFNDKNKYVRVADVLCDLKHYCNLNNIDIAEENRLADIYYDSENEKTKLMEIQTNQPVRYIGATDWTTYIRNAKKTGLESPTPYEVIPYKNGIGIKKIKFL